MYITSQSVSDTGNLGITVASSLKSSSQCAKAAAKAMQVLDLIKRNFVLYDEEDFRLLFIDFVRPHLEYYVSVWSPYLRKKTSSVTYLQVENESGSSVVIIGNLVAFRIAV